ncbi:hypothetical protein V1525DRAFT_433717 [Lipomyces kononenkoae]|uniref:Uncharacterized protein n=1 Tax=Lipomyces kononenkoae TaxID=34357 RepID=A0ACC3SYJ5_LIPKO
MSGFVPSIFPRSLEDCLPPHSSLLSEAIAPNRSSGRDVLLYDISKPDEVIGGLYLTPSFNKRTFLMALDILLVSDCQYEVYLRGSDIPLRPITEPLQQGKYDIKPIDPNVFVTNKLCITRVLSHSTTGRNEAFRKQVRERDRKCVVTGLANTERNIADDDWSVYHAAYIVPLSAEEYFIANNFSRWITNRTGENDTGINSCQNGVLLQTTVHRQFDNFTISVNVDDDYRIVTFRYDLLNLGGRQLDPICRNPKNDLSVRNELLRWHFHQAVLANISEPIFEFDFPPTWWAKSLAARTRRNEWSQNSSQD